MMDGNGITEPTDHGVKYLILLIALLAVLPLTGWLRRNPQYAAKVWIVMGILPFVVTAGPHPLYIAVISWAGWPGYVKGAEVSAIDIFVLAIYFSQPHSRSRLPFRISMALYFIAVLVSALQSETPVPPLLYAWQLVRMFLVFSVVARACSDPRVPEALLSGMAIGIWFQVGVAAWQRFGLGDLQPGGTVGDKNLLGLMSHFVGITWFALLLAGQRGLIPYLGPLGSAITAVLTVSRAALGLTASGFGLVFLISAVRKWTSKKGKMALLGAAIVLAFLPIVYSSLEARFSSEPISNYDERAAFQNAAEMMLADHPMGVGANNYVVVANTGGYNARANVATVQGSLSTNVHNAYLLAAAETGYFGLAAFVLLLLGPLIIAFRSGWRCRDQRGDLLLGLGVTLLIVYIHCFFEWVFFAFQSQYLFAITVGLVAGLAQQVGYLGHARAHDSQLDSSAARNKAEFRGGF